MHHSVSAMGLYQNICVLELNDLFDAKMTVHCSIYSNGFLISIKRSTSVLRTELIGFMPIENLATISSSFCLFGYVLWNAK